jgi:hypothetical protein
MVGRGVGSGAVGDVDLNFVDKFKSWVALRSIAIRK